MRVYEQRTAKIKGGKSKGARAEKRMRQNKHDELHKHTHTHTKQWKEGINKAAHEQTGYMEEETKSGAFCQ